MTLSRCGTLSRKKVSMKRFATRPLRYCIFHNNFYRAVTPAVILAEAGTGVLTTNGNRHSRAGGSLI